MQIKEGLEINNYKDFQKYKCEIFNIIEDTLNLIFKEIEQKNSTFLIKDYDKLVSFNDI